MDHRAHSRVDDTIVFSPDGTSVAYWAGDGDVDILIVNDSELASTDYQRLSSGFWATEPPVFSPDGSRLAFVQGLGKECKVVAGSYRRTHKGPYCFGLSFSPTGDRIGYAVYQGHEIRIVVDGIEHPTGFKASSADVVFYENHGVQGVSPVFHGDFDVASGFADASYEIAVRERFERSLTQPVFGPDGKRVAYLRNVNSKCKWPFGFRERVPGSKCDGARSVAIAVDTSMSEPFDFVYGYEWEDSRTLRAIVRRDGKYARVTLRTPDSLDDRPRDPESRDGAE